MLDNWNKILITIDMLLIIILIVVHNTTQCWFHVFVYIYSDRRLCLQDCRMPFVSGQFFDHEGQPYCETHYHAKRGSLCAGCHKPIAGRCITAMFKKFHPEHFVCAFCLKQLNKGTFKEQNDKPYCHSCFEKLFG